MKFTEHITDMRKNYEMVAGRLNGERYLTAWGI